MENAVGSAIDFHHNNWPRHQLLSRISSLVNGEWSVVA